MNTYFFVAAIVLIFAQQSHAVIIQIPDEEILNKRMCVRFAHFVEKTEITKELAGKKMEVEDFVKKFDQYLENYFDYLKSPGLICIVRYSKNDMILPFVQDFPEAVKEVEKNFVKEKE
jgi:hypothetical protein